MRLTKRRYLFLGISLAIAFLPYTVAVYYAMRFFNVPADTFLSFLIGDSGFVFILLAANCFALALKNKNGNHMEA